MSLSEQRSPEEALLEYYISAKEYLHACGYWPEVWYHKRCSFGAVSEKLLLQELAWVVLSAGMRETVVRRAFKAISTSFYEWRDVSLIVEDRDACAASAIKHFKHPRKIEAIVNNCEIVARSGVACIVDGAQKEGPAFFRMFNYVGPITCCHLAKNLGMDVVKSDRHLVRTARRAGFRDPVELCDLVASFTGDPLSVVDSVFWRYATLVPSYQDEIGRLVSSGVHLDDQHPALRRVPITTKDQR